jgi:type II secretory pathway pseudopilin PulG
MKTSGRSTAGYTLIELAVAAGVAVVVAALFFSVLRTFSHLSAKNAAINLTHTQARAAIHRAVTEIRDSVSIPQLTDTAGTPLAATSGPAAGVSYQGVVAGPYLVWSTAAAGQNTIKITARAGDPPFTAGGLRLIVPSWFIEDDVTAVGPASGSPLVRTVTLANPLLKTITCASGAPNFVAYFTQRSALAVVGSELRYYAKKGAPQYTVVSANLTSPTPFSVPNGDNRFIQAAFATQDPRILNRGFKSMNLKTNLTVPYRYRLTTYQ